MNVFQLTIPLLVSYSIKSTAKHLLKMVEIKTPAEIKRTTIVNFLKQ